MIRHFLFGQVDIPAPVEAPWEPSTLFYCQSCGKVYARIVVEKIKDRKNLWRPWPGCCIDCILDNDSIYLHIPGSIWSPWDRGFNARLPEGIVKREFELHIDYFLKEAMEWGS